MDASSNQTTMILCPPSIDRYIKNLTSSYTEKSNEASMVSASVIMFVLAGLFFNLNLFSGISDVSATLDPKVRLFLSSALSLLLPVMSYLFSEAKNAATATAAGATSFSSSAAELSMGAGLILAWMLLVELLRKKVDEIRMRGFSGSIQRAGRVVWLGSLVFFNIRSTGRKALFAILWILCATRVVQRIAYTEIGKNSYAHGKNARLINSYMAKKLQEEAGDEENQAAAHGARHDDDDDVEQAPGPGQVKNGRDLLKSCSYIVMGEEKLVRQPTADGYELDLTSLGNGDSSGGVITVGKVWELNENDDIFASQVEVQRLKRLCLSFALFKLLRRKFERLPAVTDKEAEDCRSLIFRGLLHSHSSNAHAGGSSAAAAAAEEVFQVMNDEVVFLSEYYHSVVPVVLASPFFLFVNYFLVLAVVAALCVMTVILCGNGDAVYAFTSIGDDNYTFRSGIGRIAICLILKASKNSPEAFFSIVDLSITLLLFVIYFYEEIWEFFVFLLSNWFMVSLVCSYMAKPHWRDSPWIRYAFHRIIWLRSKLNHGSLSFRQFSVLHHRWPLGLPFFSTLSLVLRTELVPNNLKQSIVERLMDGHCTGGRSPAPAYLTPLTNGKAALQSNFLFDKLSWACRSDSVSEVFLTWHIATCILETQRRGGEGAAAAASRRAAVRLSKYCAYLVAFHPELLPDSPDKTERVVDDMKAELGSIFWCWEYYLLSERARAKKMMDAAAAAAAEEQVNNGVVRNGAKLGRLLIGVADAWKVLADVWTELIVFVAPSSDEERVKGHQDVLVQGGEFITVLWALTTHIGVSHSANNKLPVKTLEDLMGESMRNAPHIAPEISNME
ncbi:hypothetical protein BDA96_10G017400 [Sorghum bicolor]|uniref:DUF4220 domain-containing protein n=2 Tax=Sorghum bicolor TaxID=4558 RepID=A0A194YGS4_SORBI|nr:uncharacterized protein LOC8066990 [Sorghum bicolor]KAG0512481.1 hypothetical protein BDA96_10G017400 [Sorghum bicolor]KXG19160.2 hypothetical protein SORBI_3010G014800 [Sorghum bicolor]|eukprot:XP_021304819.1 uncharacterized protein LOC8066990 [Sorghum bicolor]